MANFAVRGAKGCGKDTLAAFLVKNHGFTRVAFADALYVEVSEAFGVTVEHLQCRETKETPQERLSLFYCKDTAFNMVAMELLVNQGFKGTIDELSMLPLSPRQVLQWWGTEYRRVACGKDSYWLDIIQDKVLNSEGGKFIFTDCRYRNEIQFLKSLGFTTVEVVRPDLVVNATTDMHPSERELAEYPCDVVLTNVPGDIESAYRQLLGMNLI